MMTNNMMSTDSIRGKKVCALIVAAGRGTRMNMDQNKQYVDIAGKPVLARTIQAFEGCGAVDEIIVVVNEQDLSYCRREIIEKYAFIKVKSLVGGGAERQDSVYNGLLQLNDEYGLVLVHDGARPFIDNNGIIRCMAEAEKFGSACIAVRVKDTVKRADEEGFIAETPDRSSLWQVQTPQAFKYEIIIKAYQSAAKDGFRGTDDAVLAERLGYRTKLVPGSYYNIKITTKEDLLIAGAIASMEQNG